MPGSPSVAFTAGTFNSQVSSAVAPENNRCGKGQFEVQEGDLSGAQDFVTTVELQTAGG